MGRRSNTPSSWKLRRQAGVLSPILHSPTCVGGPQALEPHNFILTQCLALAGGRTPSSGVSSACLSPVWEYPCPCHHPPMARLCDSLPPEAPGRPSRREPAWPHGRQRRGPQRRAEPRTPSVESLGTGTLVLEPARAIPGRPAVNPEGVPPHFRNPRPSLWRRFQEHRLTRPRAWEGQQVAGRQSGKRVQYSGST